MEVSEVYHSQRSARQKQTPLSVVYLQQQLDHNTMNHRITAW